MGARDDGGRAHARAGLPEQLRRGSGGSSVSSGNGDRPDPLRHRLRGPLGGKVVEPRAKPLGQPARVCEDDRGPVALDQVKDPLFNMRPDRVLPDGIAAG